MHGGVVSYAADNALTYAGGTMLDWAVVTSEFKINYLRPAVGERLIARAEAVYAGKSQAVCRCDVFMVVNGDEKLCAVAQGTIARLPAKDSPVTPSWRLHRTMNLRPTLDFCCTSGSTPNH